MHIACIVNKRHLANTCGLHSMQQHNTASTAPSKTCQLLMPHLAVDDIEVLIAEVFEHFIDVLFLVEQGQRMQQVTPARQL